MHVGTVAVHGEPGAGSCRSAPIYLAGVALVAALLVYEQSLVSATDLSQVKRAFDLNGYVGILSSLPVVTALAPLCRLTRRRDDRGHVRRHRRRATTC